jgi:hypothetical protein
MSEFEIDGHTYRTIKMNGREQFHLLRKTGSMAGIFARFAAMPTPEGEGMQTLSMMVAFWQEFGKMTQAEADDLLTHCLTHTRRIVGGNGAGLVAMPMFQGRDMFDDVPIMTIMRICIEVIRENLGGFFPTASVPDISQPMPSGLTPTMPS